MEITVIARQMLLYGHIIAFALALATILKEDVRLLRAQRIDSASLHATAKLVQWLLLALLPTRVRRMARRAKQVGDGQLISAALFERPEGLGCVVDFTGVDDAVAVGVECLDYRRGRGRSVMAARPVS